MKFTIVALIWELFATVYCEQYDASYLEEMSGKMERECSSSNANQPEYGAKAYPSIVSFKQGEEHKVAGILLTVKHAVAVLACIIYLDTITPSDFIEVGACFEPPHTRYPIRKLSYNRKKFPTMNTRKQKHELGIVTLVDAVKETSHVSPITAHIYDGNGFEKHMYIIGLTEAKKCIKYPYIREDTSPNLSFIDDNIRKFDKYTASKFLFQEDHLLAVAIDVHRSNYHQRIHFERFDVLYDRIKNWLWKNNEVSILGDWLTDGEKRENPAIWKPYDCLDDVLWEGCDEVDDK